RDLASEWRKNIGLIEGAQEVTTRAVIGRTRDPVAIKLAMPALDTSLKTTAVLSEVSSQIQAELETYTGLFDIHDTFERTKEEVRPTLRPDALQRGLTRAMVGRQVQGGFFGHEAQRIQRGQNEVRVMVRYPLAEREAFASLENMHILTTDGASMPLTAVADLEMSESFPSIRRTDLARTLYVVADADKYNPALDLEKIRVDLEPKVAALVEAHPGMSYSFDGESRERAESFAALRIGGIIVLLGIYAMLAIPFKSYSQPLIVMAIIPFSITGALLGHMIMGATFSIMSAFGLLAMAGVVVNDSLVMVHYINRKRAEGLPILEAVRNAGGARFRPILLTSLTTFGGILPTMFEKSTQAQFVVPMGISLAWGVLFATFITLILVPICYLILEDIKGALSNYWGWQTGRKPEPKAA
ncbi:MAG: efflux RND transporter permease subunit, partial [Verrucomicrobiia bacterium]